GLGALKVINVYGWGLCGGLHTVEAALWREVGWRWRYVGWSDPGHTTVEAFYGGRWHYLDSFLKFYAWVPEPRAPGRRTVPGHGCGDKDYRNCPALGPVLEPYTHSGGRRRSYANGTLRFAPDLTGGAFLRGLAGRDNVKQAGGKLVPADPARPASITVALQS